MVLQHSLFCNVFYLSFSFKLFANVSLSYWSPKTHKLNRPIKKRGLLSRWLEREQVFEGIHDCDQYFAATETGTPAKYDCNPQFDPAIDNHSFSCCASHSPHIFALNMTHASSPLLDCCFLSSCFHNTSKVMLTDTRRAVTSFKCVVVMSFKYAD